MRVGGSERMSGGEEERSEEEGRWGCEGVFIK